MIREPLIEKISEYLEQGFRGFHTPGHQQGHGLEAGLKKLLGSAPQADLTEVWELDNLKNPGGCLAEAQALTARLFGSVQSFFLVNGSTVGIQTGLLTLNSGAGKVLLPRNAHLSVLNGLVLSGGSPVGVPAVVDGKWGLPLGVKPSVWRDCLQQVSGVDCLVAQQPSYQGVGCAVPEIIRIAGDFSVPLLVDEAHGAHLYFHQEDKWSAQRNKADLVVHSTHKTLGALTQASILHINNPRYLPQALRSLAILQTSSPSYLLMASLDGMQGQMSREGRQLAQKALELAYSLRENIVRIKGYSLFEPEAAGGWFQDPTKTVLSAADLGLTGWELADILRERYGILAEQAAHYYVLFLITLGHTSRDTRMLLKALQEIARYHKKGAEIPPAVGDTQVFGQEVLIPELTPRQVFTAGKEVIAWQESRGRIAAEPWTIYPPGIPLVWPGQVIGPQHLDYLQEACRRGQMVEGLLPEGRIRVVSES